jgi:hypothetical protein
MISSSLLAFVMFLCEGIPLVSVAYVVLGIYSLQIVDAINLAACMRHPKEQLLMS